MPITPSEKEEAYFAKQEFERRKKAEAENAAKLQEEEKQRLKELHFMCCPKCGMNLAEINYNGVLVDKCTNCGGVWLDAGELEQVSKFDQNKFSRWLNVLK